MVFILNHSAIFTKHLNLHLSYNLPYGKRKATITCKFVYKCMYMCNKHICVNNRAVAFLMVNGKNDDDMMILLPKKLDII